VSVESREVFGDVHAIEPLSYGHDFLVLSVAYDVLSMFHALISTVSVLYEVLLDLGHRDFVVG